MSDKKQKSPKNFSQKLKKIVLISCGILVVLLIAAVLFLNSIVKMTICHAGPAIAGVRMSLESINVYLLRGRIEINDLIIYNPDNKGYSSEHAIRLGHVTADVKPLSFFFGPKTVVEELILRDIRINYETSYLLNSNLQDILANLEQGEKKSKAPEQTETAEDSSAPRNLEVDRFVMENVGLYVILKGQSKTGAGISLTIPPIGPLGTNPEGISPYRLGMDAMLDLLATVSKQGGIKLSETASDTSHVLQQNGKKLLNDAADSFKGLFKKEEK